MLLEVGWKIYLLKCQFEILNEFPKITIDHEVHQGSVWSQWVKFMQ